MDQLLVTTDWLQEHLADDTVRIVDIRGHVIAASEPLPHYFSHRADYIQSHIPGAVFVDWVHEITDPADPRHAQIAPPERYAAVMSRLGIGPDTHVIAYDDADSMFAARLWWSLNYYGHTHVSVLDGGWKKWTAEGRPVTDSVPEILPAHFVARPNPALYRTGEQVAHALGDNQALIDVRTPDEFAGRSSRAARRGHIPTAVNIGRGKLVAPDGTMPDADTLKALFAPAIRLDTPADDVVFYCNGGVSASYGLLAWRMAGNTGGAVYDGSWKDWGNADDVINRPVIGPDAESDAR